MKKPLTAIFLVVFIDLLGFGMIIPILPYYAKAYGASATELGWLMMSYSAMQFLFSPVWGHLSDRIGRRPVILITLAGISGSMALLGQADSLFWLFVARIFAGFFGANIATAYAYIADVTPPDKRAKGMGMIGAAFGLGFLFGPAMGGLLSIWSYDAAAYTAAILAAGNFFLSLKILSEPRISEKERSSHRFHFPWTRLIEILKQPGIGRPTLVFFLMTLGMAQLETSFAFYVLAKFGLDAFHAGLILAVMALAMALIQGGLIGRLVDKFGESRLILMGCFLMGISLILSMQASQLGFFVFSLTVFGMGYGLAHPSLSALVSQGAGASIQGLTLGVYQSAGSMARISGPILAGYLFDYAMTYPFYLASLMIALGFLISLFFLDKKRVKG